jgi:phenylpyruvate tautomerase PptA (4-oxalocrotonate tautomerase family)
MIDVYAPAGTFRDPHALAAAAAATIMRIEHVPDIPMFRENTAGFVHELSSDAISDVDGRPDHVRVQVLTNAGALDRTKQLQVVEQLTALVAEHAGNPALATRTWVLLTEAIPGGWGLWGHAHTNEELVAAAREAIAAAQRG